MTSPKKRKFACSTCKKTYGKSEHLKRHERMHTGSKPYTCPYCGTVFSRQDSWSRHVKRHQRADSSNAVTDTDVLALSRLEESQNHSSSNINQFESDTNHISLLTTTSENQQLSSNTLTAGDHSTSNVDSENATDHQLNWPDAEDLLQSILSVDAPAWHTNDVFSLPALNSGSAIPDLSQPISAQRSTGLSSVTHDGHEAVQDLSEMITNVAFWNHFVPSFPIFHAPTFVFRDWAYPLLLNAIAIGSLFTGQSDDRRKGEVLWKLAYTAVATSWQTLIKHKGPHDSCCGVQLVLTALLGQIYAISSTNDNIRTVSRVFHSMGFFWAQESGLYHIDQTLTPSFLQSANETEEEGYKRWQIWAAREVQLRALLGHYILDSQIAQYNGGRVCQRHSANPLPLPCNDDAFTASTYFDWTRATGQRQTNKPTFRDTITALFSTHVHTDHLRTIWTTPTIQVVIAALKSLLYEVPSSTPPPIGCPTRSDIAYALSRLYSLIQNSPHLSPANLTLHLIQWHALALETRLDPAQLCHDLCQHLGVSQCVVRGKRAAPFEPAWSHRHARALRLALPHAAAIRDGLKAVPRSHARHFHLSGPTFAAALVYTALRVTDTSAEVVRVDNWPSFVQIPLEPSAGTFESDAPIERYLHAHESDVVCRDVHGDLQGLAATLLEAGGIWGVAHELLDIVKRLNWDLPL